MFVVRLCNDSKATYGINRYNVIDSIVFFSARHVVHNNPLDTTWSRYCALCLHKLLRKFNPLTVPGFSHIFIHREL